MLISLVQRQLLKAKQTSFHPGVSFHHRCIKVKTKAKKYLHLEASTWMNLHLPVGWFVLVKIVWPYEFSSLKTNPLLEIMAIIVQRRIKLSLNGQNIQVFTIFKNSGKTALTSTITPFVQYSLLSQVHSPLIPQSILNTANHKHLFSPRNLI